MLVNSYIVPRCYLFSSKKTRDLSLVKMTGAGRGNIALVEGKNADE